MVNDIYYSPLDLVDATSMFLEEVYLAFINCSHYIIINRFLDYMWRRYKNDGVIPKHARGRRM
jgi:hypothetical protein